MTTVEAAETAIERRWATLIATPEALPTQYENGPIPDRQADQSYARLRMFGGESPQVAVGGPRGLYRTLGLTVAEIFVPAGSGALPARRLVDAIKLAFQNVKADDVTYVTVAAENIGPDGGHYQININLSYYFDEV
jgi:hypothetical protein